MKLFLIIFVKQNKEQHNQQIELIEERRGEERE